MQLLKLFQYFWLKTYVHSHAAQSFSTMLLALLFVCLELNHVSSEAYIIGKIFGQIWENMKKVKFIKTDGGHMMY